MPLSGSPGDNTVVGRAGRDGSNNKGNVSCGGNHGSRGDGGTAVGNNGNGGNGGSAIGSESVRLLNCILGQHPTSRHTLQRLCRRQQ